MLGQLYIMPISGQSLVFYPPNKIKTEWRRWLADLVTWQAEPLFDWSGVEYKRLGPNIVYKPTFIGPCEIINADL